MESVSVDCDASAVTVSGEDDDFVTVKRAVGGLSTGGGAAATVMFAVVGAEALPAVSVATRVTV